MTRRYKLLLLPTAMLLIIIIAIASLYRRKSSEEYSNVGADWSIHSVHDDKLESTEVLDKFYKTPPHLFLSETTPLYKYPLKTHAENKKTAMEMMKENSIDMGERLKFNNFIRVHDL